MKVTVIMSVYNGFEYLSQALESILFQTFRDFEFIITDDGSNQCTRDLLEKYANRDQRIVLRRQENMGLTITLNKMLAEANGEFIARQDADDISTAERLSEQVAFLNTHPEISLVGTGGELIGKDSAVIRIEHVRTHPNELRLRLRLANQFIHGSVLMRRSHIIAVGGYDERFRYAQDYDLFLRLAERYQIANIDKPLYRYRIDGSAISTARALEQQEYAEVARRKACHHRSGRHSSVDALLKKLRSFPYNRIIQSRAKGERARTDLLLGHRNEACKGFTSAFLIFPAPRYLWHAGRSLLI